MFNDIAEKLFILVIQKRQYNFYLENLKLYSIPSALPLFTFPIQQQLQTQQQAGGLTNRTVANTVITSKDELANSINISSPSKQAADSEKFYDIRYYNELMDSIPAEYVSTPIILHCMLEQVLYILF